MFCATLARETGIRQARMVFDKSATVKEAVLRGEKKMKNKNSRNPTS